MRRRPVVDVKGITEFALGAFVTEVGRPVSRDVEFDVPYGPDVKLVQDGQACVQPKLTGKSASGRTLVTIAVDARVARPETPFAVLVVGSGRRVRGVGSVEVKATGEEEARLRRAAEAETQRLRDELLHVQQEVAAERKREEEARGHREAEAQRRHEEEERLRRGAEAEAQRLRAEVARLHEEAEAERTREDERLRREAEAEAQRRREEEAGRRQEAEAQRKRDEEERLRRGAEAAGRKREEEQGRLRREAETEAQRLRAEVDGLRREAEAQRRRDDEERLRQDAASAARRVREEDEERKLLLRPEVSKRKDFDVVSVVGCGGQATVELWRQRARGGIFAAKVFLRPSAKLADRVADEARMLLTLTRPIWFAGSRCSCRSRPESQR
jgi:hypothetical protein